MKTNLTIEAMALVDRALKLMAIDIPISLSSASISKELTEETLRQLTAARSILVAFAMGADGGHVRRTLEAIVADKEGGANGQSSH